MNTEEFMGLSMNEKVRTVNRDARKGGERSFKEGE